ncbi:BgTH12-05056 [Blumeria graminis f. sp. triticale]|uniref:DNA-binding protein RAP1 n=1 Tax=Blumeria graminis f. sp. triticale TaxID=1689686 RepID=A0A9W4GED6_BLUGR|nr:BgTH12-05056 [Blumeria graminis f. sp. triticale]
MAIPSVGSRSCEELFHDKRFFLLQKIPDRSHVKELITKRGGVVVKVEEQADLVIADHDGKFAPPGSISWTYIRDSDEKGYLQNVNDHLAGPTSLSAPRSLTMKFKQSTRTVFSKEDDKFLYKHCISAEKEGIKTNGNKFYQKLEQMNNRHTFQSWRDRWIKKGPFLKQKYSNEIACENIAQDHHSTGNRSNVTDIQHQLELEPNYRTPNKSPTPNQDVIKNPSLKHSELKINIPQDQIIVSPGGEFTQYETDLLLDAYTDIMEVDEAQSIAAWMAWAYEYPNHTAQEWRNYFVEYVKPMHDRNSSGTMEISTNLEATASPHALADQSLVTNVYAPIKNLEDGNLQRTPGSNMSQDYNILNEKGFRKAVQRIATKVHLIFNENLEICGRKIPLSEIWKTAQLPEFGGLDKITENNLWCSIARKLGFNSRDTAAANELSYCYHEILARLGKNGFTIDSEKKNEKVIYTDQVTHMEDNCNSEGRSIQVPLHSLQKSDGNSLKRRINQHSKLQKYAETKRRRVNDNKDASLEVPATPEEKITASLSALLFDGKLSPVNQLSLGSFEKNENEILSPFDKSIHYNRRLDFRAPNSRFVSPSEFHDMDQEAPYSLIPPVSSQEYGTTSKLVSGKHYEKLVTQKNEVANEAHKDCLSPCLETSCKNYNYCESQSLGTEDDFGQHLIGKQKSCTPLLKLCQKTESSVCSQGHTHDKLTTSTLKNVTNDVPEERNRDLLQEFITDQVIGLGFPQDVIIEALEATSMKIGLESHIQQVMDSILNGDGIPDNLSGVWTLDDDKALKEQARGKEYERIVKKHGKEEIKLRHQFWIDMEDADDTG